jgi:hypothetical protein
MEPPTKMTSTPQAEMARASSAESTLDITVGSITQKRRTRF